MHVSQCVQHRYHKSHLRNTHRCLLAEAMRRFEVALLHSLSHNIEDETATHHHKQQALWRIRSQAAFAVSAVWWRTPMLTCQCGGMDIRHHNTETGNTAWLSSEALAECAMADGVQTGLPFRGQVTMELQATLNEIRIAYSNGKCFKDTSAEITAHMSGRGGKRVLAQLQQWDAHADADARHAALSAALLTARRSASSQVAAAARADLERGSMHQPFDKQQPPPAALFPPHWSFLNIRSAHRVLTPLLLLLPAGTETLRQKRIRAQPRPTSMHLLRVCRSRRFCHRGRCSADGLHASDIHNSHLPHHPPHIGLHRASPSSHHPGSPRSPSVATRGQGVTIK